MYYTVIVSLCHCPTVPLSADVIGQSDEHGQDRPRRRLRTDAYEVNRNDASMNREEGQEGGAEKGQQEGGGREGEKLLHLGHEHDAWEVRKADASEWPPDF